LLKLRSEHKYTVLTDTEFLLLTLVVNIMTNKLRYMLFNDGTVLESQAPYAFDTQTEC